VLGCQQLPKRHDKFFGRLFRAYPLALFIIITAILRQREIIIEHLNRSYLVKTENDDIPLYVMRNTLARLPDYSFIKDRKPYVDEKSGRLRFNIDEGE